MEVARAPAKAAFAPGALASASASALGIVNAKSPTTLLTLPNFESMTAAEKLKKGRLAPFMPVARMASLIEPVRFLGGHVMPLRATLYGSIFALQQVAFLVFAFTVATFSMLRLSLSTQCTSYSFTPVTVMGVLLIKSPNLKMMEYCFSRGSLSMGTVM